jgi:FAD/FMN-containing dehydrogenase
VHVAVPWRSLAASLDGRLVRPGDPTYRIDRQLFNKRFDGIRPAGIAYCQSASDVQRCVDFARRHGVQVAARSGGHSYGGYSLCHGLVVDVTAMSEIRVGRGGRQATVGAGARLVDVYASLGQQGYLLPSGSCPTVGIAGLTLGGGVGVFSRQYGLTCDQLSAVHLVTADGHLLICDRTRHENLLWACQGGGGGNFGIVTSFTFDVHPIPPIVLFSLVWPWSAAIDTLGAWLRWVPGTPDALWSNCQLLSAGNGGGGTPPTVRVTGVFCGALETLNALLATLSSAVGAAPLYEFVGPEQYLPAMLVEAGCEGESVAACHLRTQDPAGTLTRSAFAAKSAYVTSALPDSALTVAVEAVTALGDEVPDVGGGIVFDSYGGAVNRVAPGATAFVHRDALAGLQWSFTWPTGAKHAVLAAGTSWLAATAHRLSPYVSGAYQNYIDPTLTDWLQAYYGSNLPRLVEVKRAVDPDDFFHFAQSVPTRLGASRASLGGR